MKTKRRTIVRPYGMYVILAAQRRSNPSFVRTPLRGSRKDMSVVRCENGEAAEGSLFCYALLQTSTGVSLRAKQPAQSEAKGSSLLICQEIACPRVRPGLHRLRRFAMTSLQQSIFVTETLRSLSCYRIWIKYLPIEHTPPAKRLRPPGMFFHTHTGGDA
jgi:hypothetical protein